jgi:hypothetical protein
MPDQIPDCLLSLLKGGVKGKPAARWAPFPLFRSRCTQSYQNQVGRVNIVVRWKEPFFDGIRTPAVRPLAAI